MRKLSVALTALLAASAWCAAPNTSSSSGMSVISFACLPRYGSALRSDGAATAPGFCERSGQDVRQRPYAQALRTCRTGSRSQNARVCALEADGATHFPGRPFRS